MKKLAYAIWILCFLLAMGGAWWRCGFRAMGLEAIAAIAGWVLNGIRHMDGEREETHAED